MRQTIPVQYQKVRMSLSEFFNYMQEQKLVVDGPIEWRFELDEDGQSISHPHLKVRKIADEEDDQMIAPL